MVGGVRVLLCGVGQFGSGIGLVGGVRGTTMRCGTVWVWDRVGWRCERYYYEVWDSVGLG